MELISQNICDSKISNLGKFVFIHVQQTNKQNKRTNEKQHEQTKLECI